MDANSEKVLVQLMHSARVAALGTLRDGAPHVALVAFAYAEDLSAFYIHISRLAQHTVDLQRDKRVSLMISEADDGRENVQSLARISIRALAEFVVPGEPGYTPAKMKYQERFPGSKPIFDLEDFGLWRIIPKNARFVAGFGRAYNLTPDSIKLLALQ